MRACDEQRFKDSKKTAAGQRPSMGQDMQKGRRTEIEFMNGHVGQTAQSIRREAPLNHALTDLVLAVERGTLKADPKHVLELKL